MTDLVSQNGWSASPDPGALGVVPYRVADVPIGDGLRGGVVATVLGHVALQVHRRVETLVVGWCWGYKYRAITGSATLSNHASGTAVDLNAPRHPLGSRGTFAPAQVDELRRVLAEVDGVVRWGGDYVGRADEMHFEIDADEAAVAAVAARLERTVQLLDYSRGYPGAAAIQRAGYGGAVRYLRKEGTSEVKPLTRDEADDFHERGLDLGLFYQHVDRTRSTQGRAAGQHDARWALDQAAACGVDVRAITMCVDFDATPSTVAEYFRGVVDVLGLDRTGAYGSYRVVRYLLDQHLTRYAHQTAAWSSGQRESRAHLFQRVGAVTVNGVQCDINDVLQDDWGQENYREDDVPLTDADVAKIWGAPNGFYEGLRNLFVDGAAQNPAGGYADQLRGALRTMLTGLPVTLDAGSIAALVTELAPPLVDALAEHGASGLTAAQVETALATALARTSLVVGPAS